MKTIVATLLLIYAVNVVIAQSMEKTIEIKELNKSDISIPDTITQGYRAGEVYVTRFPSSDYSESGEKKDTLIVYTIHFLEIFQKKLSNYGAVLQGEGNYDRFTYSWESDSLLSVTFINFITTKRKTVKIIKPSEKQGCCLAGITEESVNAWFDEK